MPANAHNLDADIIIVGAGVSGLTAAYTLLEKEPTLDILILEAKDTIGGRTLSAPLLNRNKEFKLHDIGGQWISSQQTSLLLFLERLNVQTEKPCDEGGKIILDYNGKVFVKRKVYAFDICGVRAKFELANFVKKIENICENISSLDENLATMSMAEFIATNLKHDVNKAIIDSMILCNCGVDAANLTVGFYLFFCISTHGIVNQLFSTPNGLREIQIKNGAQEICNKLADLMKDDVAIFNKVVVCEIKSQQHEVAIKTLNNDILYSHNVIVAVPPSAIRRISFVPSLQKTKTMESSVCGNLISFVASYEAAFWKKQGYSGEIYVLNGYNSNRPLLCCFCAATNGTIALSGYAIRNGNAAKNLLLQLSQYFGEAALKPLQIRVKPWLEGSPMCCYKSFHQLVEVKSDNGRIFWAGAETSPEWYGTIAGAVCAGQRAANELLYANRPAIMSRDEMHTIIFRSGMPKIKKEYRSNIHQKLVKRYQLAVIWAAVLLTILWRKRNIITLRFNDLVRLIKTQMLT